MLHSGDTYGETTQISMEVAAKKMAAKKVSEMLSNPSQMAKVEDMKIFTKMQFTQAENSVKTMMSSLLEETKLAYSLIDESQRNIDTIQNSMIPPTDHLVIREVDLIRRNLSGVLMEIGRFIKIPDMIQRIETMMERDINILSVHGEVRMLEKMRDSSMKSAAMDPEELAILIRIFDPVQNLLRTFDEKLMKIFASAISLVQKSPAVIVKAVQVVEREQMLDDQVRSHLLKKKKDPEDPSNRDEFRFYREKAYQAISQSVQEHFQETFGDNSADAFTDLSQKLLDELPVVLDELIFCFPKSWKIFEYYCKEYHKNFITTILNYSIQPEKITPNDIIEIIGWAGNGYQAQMEGLGYDPQPPLQQACEPLYGTYRDHIRALMTEWAKRFVEQDIEKEPEIVDGLVVTLAPTLLFESVDVQIKIARDTNDSAFFFGTMVETANALEVFQSEVLQRLRDNWQDLPLEWIMAQINNAFKCCDKIDQMVSTLAPLLEEPYDSQIAPLYEPIGEKFTTVSKESLSVLADVIWKDLEAPLDQIFDLDWYDNKDFINPIIATIGSYFGDIDTYIVENYFRRLCMECLDRLTQTYIRNIFEKSHTLDSNTAERLITDEEKIRTFFTQHIKDTIVNPKLQILADLRELIDAEADMLPLYFHSIVKNYPDVTTHIIAALLSMRKDLSKSEMKSAVEGCEKVMEKEGTREMKKTIFSTHCKITSLVNTNRTITVYLALAVKMQTVDTEDHYKDCKSFERNKHQ
ncbi:hypothetical protein PROFUN_07715 [Planoprotostelium fungivorum]|uniref:Uncharacterized protein n=1 Tax=Planoprotostelium fungivorum TaxID=1890364 RepID=A0A2P6N1G8_9EUKA|nr:hypothetical protein PROFUN_07715 [Planoprotostelium fungivorum]